MENVHGFKVDKKDGIVSIEFLNIVEDGEVYYFTEKDTKKLMLALASILNT